MIEAILSSKIQYYCIKMIVIIYIEFIEKERNSYFTDKHV